MAGSKRRERAGVEARDRRLARLDQLLAPLPRVGAIAAGILACIAACVELAVEFGIGGGLAGAVVVGVALYGFVWLQRSIGEAGRRESYREQAFRWRGVAADVQPGHLDVRQSQGRLPNVAIAPYVERSVTGELREGLVNNRLVIITGPRPSGKSRLVYELLSNGHDGSPGDDGTVILISRNALANADFGDPLAKLMADRGALGGDKTPTILVVRDFVTRLLQRTITADLVRDWVEHEDRGAVVLTLTPADIADIEESPAAREDLKQLEPLACVILLSHTFDEEETELAQRIYPNLTQLEHEWLPDYLCSALPLRRKFSANSSGNTLGTAIVRAIADWRRAGMTRPVGESYIRSVINDYAPGYAEEDFRVQLEWALEPVEAAMSLIRTEGEGYVPDRIVPDLIDGSGGENRCLDEHVWRGILDHLRNEASNGRDSSATISDLIELSRAARRRGSPAIGEQALELAEELGDTSDQERAKQERLSIIDPGSAEAVVSAQGSDRPFARLVERQGVVSTDSSEAPRRVVGWVYSRILARAVVRIAVLVLADGISVALGFTVGVAVRAQVEGTGVLDVISDSLRWLPLWVAGSIFVLARLRLYKQDAPRARLSPILLAALILGCIGLFSTALGSVGVGLIPEVLVGTVIATILCYQQRALYDKRSRRWVTDNGLRARTLLIGSEQQFEEFKEPLSKSTRPIRIVGFVTLKGPRAGHGECLGTVEQLASVAREHEVGRVVILDTAISRDRRQAIANFCHRREVDGHAFALKIEAVPSLADIRAGCVDFVAGQAIPLIRLEPLWQTDLSSFLKRTFDIVFAGLGVFLLAPVWLWIATMIAREGRPVLVRYDRRGRGDKLFLMYRFRTTLVDEPSDPNDGDGDQHTTHTSYGESLKERGLDELPQLLNVLLGDMSLVGPRPLHFQNRLQLSSTGMLRYVVKPGMTGPWLVSRHTHLTYSQLEALDVAYLQDWMFITDLDILAKTLRLVFRRRKFPSVFPSQATCEPNDQART